MGAFAELLKSERKRAGKKLYDTSEAVGLSVSYISDMEQARKLPPEIEIVRKFQKYFGTLGDALVKAAEAERKEMPTQVMNRFQKRPVLQKLFFRMENMTDEEIEEWLLKESGEE